MLIHYKDHRFNKESLKIIEHAKNIIEEYKKHNLMLSVRQLYYQFVSRDLIPNSDKEYKRLGRMISNGRLSGMLDWSIIEDRGRNTIINYHNSDPGQAVEDALRTFLLDKWKNQEYRPEVWIEKEALTGVIENVCSELDVPYFACKGYNSQSEMWRSSIRMKHNIENDQIPIIIHLGDHDPSGLDMTEDIRRRQDLFRCDVEIKRIALTYNQIEKYKPPPNPTKESDTRSKNYKYDASWELDALEPTVIQSLVKDTITDLIDQGIWEDTKLEQSTGEDELKNLIDLWKSSQD